MGRIYKRGNRYYGDYQTPEGKRIKRTLRTSDKAVAKERLRIAELAATPQARGRRQRLSEAIDVVIKTTMQDRAPATRGFYEEKARRIVTSLGDPWVSEITREMLGAYITRRLSDDPTHGGAKPHTIQKELIVIRRALREAFELGVLQVMPPMPRFSAKYKPREVWLEPHEFEKLAANLGRSRARENKYSKARRARRAQKAGPKDVVQALPEERVRWVSIAALAGGSHSEVESLDWKDVDLDRGWLKLRGTKRETRERWVPIAPALRARLEEVPPAQRKGRVVKPWRSVRHGLRNACKRAGLDKMVSPNDLRRTFASWLVQHEVPLLTVATLMGHSSTRMVEKVYGKLSKANLEAAIAVLPQLAAPPPGADQPLLVAGTAAYTAPEQPEDLPEVTLHLGDASWHDGAGWYYVIDEYPDEGAAGAFGTSEIAIAHAEASGYRVTPPAPAPAAMVRAERDALKVRRDELLATIRKLSAEVPYPEEQGNAGVLIAEVGTLRAYVAVLEGVRNELYAMVECLLASAVPNQRDHPTMSRAWSEAEGLLRRLNDRPPAIVGCAEDGTKRVAPGTTPDHQGDAEPQPE